MQRELLQCSIRLCMQNVVIPIYATLGLLGLFLSEPKTSLVIADPLFRNNRCG